jgi:tRNA (mo5U34)-methyltransferase
MLVSEDKLMKAWNLEFSSETQRQVENLRSLGWYHSIERPDGTIIEGHQSIAILRNRIAQFPIPDDLTGKRVLDIGAWDGWFSFEMERRGATVVAVDSTRSERFLAAREMLNSKVEYRVQDVYSLRPEDLGTFDIVLFFGVLYHLRHPLLALERMCALSTDLVCVESYVTDTGDDAASVPLMEFYEATELCGQFDNWVGPNVACLLAFCRSAGFANVKLESVLDYRAHITCTRAWKASTGTTPAPKLMCIENAATRDDEFVLDAETYLSLWFTSSEKDLMTSDVFPEIGPFGVSPSIVRNHGDDGWQVVFALPLGSKPGWTPVLLRVRDSLSSSSVRVCLIQNGSTPQQDEIASTPGFLIEIVTDGKSWERDLVHMGEDACISLWVRGFPRDRNTQQTVIRMGRVELPSVFVSETEDEKGLTQINAMLPSGMARKTLNLRVIVDDAATPEVPVQIVDA